MLLNILGQMITDFIQTPIYDFLSIYLIWISLGIIAVMLVISVLYLIFINIFKRGSNTSSKSITRKNIPIKNIPSGQSGAPAQNAIRDKEKELEVLNNELKPYGFAYEAYQDIFYSLNDCWQRDFGYCRLYDESCAPLSMIIDCEPIRFEYNGMKWMIEFWKGQYGMTTGAEVGIYSTKNNDLSIPGFFTGTLYDSVSDNERIKMAFTLKRNGKLLFSRSDLHWWLTGFRLGQFSKPSELTMDIILDLYDNEMCKAFTDALKKAGYTSKEFSSSKKRVKIKYTTPHTQQPLSRTTFTEYIMLKNDLSYCNSYQALTEDYSDTLDKLHALKITSPNMYRKAIALGKTTQIFSSFNKLKNYVNVQEEIERE